ncbi:MULTISPECIES: hypothetical protein [unclassified Chamaesiphon]|nr:MULTISPECIES: hypothetical protein [unclassified Chamaesiphon]
MAVTIDRLLLLVCGRVDVERQQHQHQRQAVGSYKSGFKSQSRSIVDS